MGMNPAVLASLISGGGSLLSSGLNLIGVNMANQANMKLAEYQADRNLELWNLNNEYNTPAKQMERYKAAGLNPNLIYGNGSSSAGNSSSPAAGYNPPDIKPLSINGNPFASATQAFLDGLSVSSTVAKNNSETAVNYQQIANLQEDNKLKQLMQVYQALQNAKTEEEKKLWSDKLRAEISATDSRAVLNTANAFLSDQNRFLIEAQRPLILAQNEANISKTLSEISYNQEKTRGVRIENSYLHKLLTAQIARLVTQAQESGNRAEMLKAGTKIKNILINSGLNIENDEFDRMVYGEMLGLKDVGGKGMFKFLKLGASVIK